MSFRENFDIRALRSVEDLSVKSIKYILFFGLFMSLSACMAPQEIEENCEVACDWAKLGRACQEACELGAYNGKECWSEHSDAKKGYDCADLKCQKMFDLKKVEEFVPKDQTMVPVQEDITNDLVGYIEDTKTLRLACQRSAEKAIDYLDAEKDRKANLPPASSNGGLKWGSCDRLAGGITRCY